MTLVFPERRSDTSIGFSSSVPLREWLGGHWAILFSHPGDFDREELERDRWLSVLSRSLSTQGVRVMRVATYVHDAQAASHGWLSELGCGCAAVLSVAPPLQGTMLDFRAGSLRAEIARSGPRFAMIIDPDLRCRRTLHYRVPVDLPSPIDLVGWVVALRDRHRSLVSARSDDTSASQLCHLSLPARAAQSSCSHAQMI